MREIGCGDLYPLYLMPRSTVRASLPCYGLVFYQSADRRVHGRMMLINQRAGDLRMPRPTTGRADTRTRRADSQGRKQNRAVLPTGSEHDGEGNWLYYLRHTSAMTASWASGPGNRQTVHMPHGLKT